MTRGDGTWDIVTAKFFSTVLQYVCSSSLLSSSDQDVMLLWTSLLHFLLLFYYNFVDYNLKKVLSLDYNFKEVLAMDYNLQKVELFFLFKRRSTSTNTWY